MPGLFPLTLEITIPDDIMAVLFKPGPLMVAVLLQFSLKLQAKSKVVFRRLLLKISKVVSNCCQYGGPRCAYFVLIQPPTTAGMMEGLGPIHISNCHFYIQSF